MKIRANKGRMEIIFPVVLFLVFTLSALFIILYAARTYQHIVEESNSEYDRSTSLAYVGRKIHAEDTNGNVSIGDIFGTTAVIIKQTIEDTVYVTYIYSYDGKLRELFTADNGNITDPAAGTVLFSVDSFEPEMISDNLLSLSITSQGKSLSQYVSIHSTEKPLDAVDPMAFPDLLEEEMEVIQ